MERLHTRLAMAVCITMGLTLGACNDVDEPPTPPAPSSNSVTLKLKDQGVGVQGVVFPWSGNEKAIVVLNDTTQSVVGISTDGSESASAVVELGKEELASYAFDVYLPSDEESGFTAVSVSQGSMNITMPATQSPSAMYPDAKAVVRYGSSESVAVKPQSVDVSLTHWSSYCKLSIDGLNLAPEESVESVVLVASDPLWGKFTYKQIDRTTSVVGGEDRLVLSSPQSVDALWIATAPCEALEWLAVTVVTSCGSYHTRTTFASADSEGLTLAMGAMTNIRVNMSGIDVMPSISPLSGTPLKASAALGLAPFTFDQTSSMIVHGSAHISSSEHPDLFVLCSSSLVGSEEGVYYCPYEATTPTGQLIYGTPCKVESYPWNKGMTSVSVFEDGGEVWAVATTATRANYCKYDPATNSFGSSWLGSVDITTGYTVASSDVQPNGDGTADILLLCETIEGSEPVTEDKIDAWYDSAGKYLGTIPYGSVFIAKIDLQNGKLLSSPKMVGEANIIAFPAGISRLRNPAKGLEGYVLSTYFGNLKFMPAARPSAVDYIYGPDGEPVTNKVTVNKMRAMSLDGDNLHDDLFVSGEAVMYHYSFADRVNSAGIPTLNHDLQVMKRSGELYGGNLSVPNVVDWDGDGALDIVAGNGGGFLLFFKNYGSTEAPAFGVGEYICRGGKPICIRAGYYELQGPQESGWGYLCPTVVDWNSDGLLDVVYSYNEGVFEVMLGEGTRTSPRLGARQAIKIDGMELYGAWRVRPAVFKTGGHTYIVTMDEDEALHLYRYASTTAVLDMGTLPLEDGGVITGYRANGTAPTLSERGRHKLEIADWDGDGVLDLLVGTTKQACFPSPNYGLPWTYWDRTRCSLDVLFLRNVGTNEDMRFAYPEMFQFKGNDMNIGTHSNAPTICMLGVSPNARPNLLVGCQSGRFFYFDRNDLTKISLW
ncbi:MAG: VCBS repeat-containing protein [Tidjanibacter sp.]|nr:VCBS repeat-containing protein [Tidjanibacter sp.]